MANGSRGFTPRAPSREVAIAIAIVVLQAVAAVFFVIDSIDEIMVEATNGVTLGVIMECLIAVALLAGVVIGARHTRKLMLEAGRLESALAVARGALAEHVNNRFAEWQLSAGEAEVALFALKGCSVSEIAELRNSASGTVRSQLSQVYAKAGVTSQSALVSLFFDDLL